MFDKQNWQTQIRSQAGRFKKWLAHCARRDAPYVVYGGVLAATLWPAIQTAALAGSSVPVILALGQIAQGIGAGLVANQIEQWRSRADKLTTDEVAGWISAEVPANPELRQTLDDLAIQLEVLPALSGGLTPDDQTWLKTTLRRELAELGNLPRFEAVLNGMGAIAQDGGIAVAAIDDGKAIGKAGENAIIGDNNQLITNVINLYLQGRPQVTDEATLRRQIADYLRGLVNRYSRLELRGVKREGQQVIQLELDRVYVPLAARSYLRGQSEEIQLDQFLRQGRHVVVTGGPGSGKTTVLLHLASTLALAIGSDRPALAQEKLGLSPLPSDEKGGGLPLPIYLPLSSYARYRRDLPKGRQAEETTLAAFISYYLIRRQQGSFDLPPDFFQQLLRTGRQVMVLLDGLDEVPGENERVEVCEAIEGLLDGRPQPKLQIVVTCRSAAYGGRAVLGRDFREVAVLPLTEAHIEQLVRQAYAAPSLFDAEPGLAQQKSNELLQAIANLETQRRRIYGDKTEPLITSPLLVRMLIIVHVSDRRLPDQRAELYKKATDNLLLPEYQPDQEVANELGGLVGGSQSIHRELAQHLAFTMHQRGDQQGRELEEFELRKILQKHPTYSHLANDFISLARSRSTLLEERDGQYRFIHLAFQEFLAAGYLADVVGGDSGYGGIVAFLESGPLLDSWWREPILLIAGYYSIDKPMAAQKFLRLLAGVDEKPSTALPPDVPLAAAEVAGAAAMEWPALPEGLKEELARRLADFFTHPAWLANTNPRLRAQAGDTLARLGDPRPEVMTVDGMQFCDVPSGPFIMGGGDDDEMADDYEKPLHQFDLPYGYWLGRYPVTVAQWSAFVAETGHKPEDNNSLADPLNRPVRWVTWYETVRYCEWLTGRWHNAGMLPKNWQVRLPSEAEWEKAARGGLQVPERPEIRTVGVDLASILVGLPPLPPNSLPQRRYPWGDEPDPRKANYDQTDINDTSAVGCFPEGSSIYGVEEMSGNVREWCATVWQEDYRDYKNDNSLKRTSIPRVLRGGAFDLDEKDVRGAARDWYGPYDWYFLSGFRVVVGPSLF